MGLPDVHSGYGFSIGNMAAFDMDDPDSIVSPGMVLVHARYLSFLVPSIISPVFRCVLIIVPLAGGVGFDINCGVRLLRTNLDESVPRITRSIDFEYFVYIYTYIYM